MKFLESVIRCYKQEYKQKKENRKPLEAIINSKKEEIESSGFKCDEEVIIAPKPEFQELIEIYEKYEKLLKENKELTKQLKKIQTTRKIAIPKILTLPRRPFKK